MQLKTKVGDEIDSRVIESLYQLYSGWNALHLAVRYGQPDTISTLLEHGIDINASNRGWTPLHLAALNGHTDIASILLNKGANVAAINEDGKSPLDIARDEKHERIVAIILEMEFQNQETPDSLLPSPPPTPPSAPPAHLMQFTPQSQDETIQEWQSRVRDELERVDGEAELDSGQDERPEDGTAGTEATFGWKSFEEEAKELLNQLERLRLQEVNKVKSGIKQCKKDHAQKMAKLDRQRHVLEAQISAIETSIPEMKANYQRQREERIQILDQIETQMRHWKTETRLLEGLQTTLKEHSFATASSDKMSLVRQLQDTHSKELQQMKEEHQKVRDDLETIKEKQQSEEKVAQEKIRILEDNMKHICKVKNEALVSQQQALDELGAQLEKAERRSHLGNPDHAPDQDEHWFGCPVCLLLLKPPMRIFQCPEGHILCEECKENPAMVHCPQCRYDRLCNYAFKDDLQR